MGKVASVLFDWTNCHRFQDHFSKKCLSFQYWASIPGALKKQIKIPRPANRASCLKDHQFQETGNEWILSELWKQSTPSLFLSGLSFEWSIL